MSDEFPLVIVGAGAGGVAAAEAARDAGFTGRMLLVTHEDRLPYKRTKISKHIVDRPARDAFALHDAEWYESNGITLITRRRVSRIDTDRSAVQFHDRSEVRYRAVILAVGAEPIDPLDDANLSVPLHFPYDFASVEGVAEEVRNLTHSASAARVGILGGGVVALELLNQFAKMGANATLMTRSGRLMARELDDHAHDLLRRSLEESGIEIYRGVRLNYASIRHGRVRLSFHDTSRDYFDVLVAASGSMPRISLARSSGLNVDSGVLVNPELQTSDERVFACGDCAEHPDGRITHLWRDALRQGSVAGSNAVRLLRGEALETYRYIPFRLKCEVFGHYFYSIGEPEPKSMYHAGFEKHVFVDSSRYVAAFTIANELLGLVMVDDREREEAYTAAVVERWTLDRFREELGLVSDRRGV